MPTYECPRSLTEPPTCTAPDQCGEIRFKVSAPEYDTNVGPQPECTEKTCQCELTDKEWEDLENRAAKSWYE